ncbi:MAG TPA: AAA family ATPase [Steroidobacteraceae bacterium]|nr:AAA family ATPase [Steroidobacteraceae bacterium]
MQRIVVLNPKGGSGKTTIAINLASHFALRGEGAVLIDHDPQASAARWVRQRQQTQAPIHLIAAFEREVRMTRTFQLRIPEGTGRVIVDTPAAISAHEMPELTRLADKILVPVLPSDIDIHACSRCIQNLLLVAKVRREDNRLGIIANRVRRNTLIYQSLERFLSTLNIPIVATLRDSQAYVRGAAASLGLAEMKPYQVAEDLAQWQPLLEWLELPPRRLIAAGASGTPHSTLRGTLGSADSDDDGFDGLTPQMSLA